MIHTSNTTKEIVGIKQMGINYIPVFCDCGHTFIIDFKWFKEGEVNIECPKCEDEKSIKEYYEVWQW